MDERRRSILVFAALAACAVTGCGATSAGQATSTSAPGAAASGVGEVAGTNGAASITFGPRPAELPVTGVDPCALLSDSQRAQLSLRPGHRAADDPKYHGPSCDFQLTGSTVSYFDVIAVPAADIRAWLDPNLYDNLTPVTVGGFPALQISPKGSSVVECTNAVSVADGQMLMVTFAFVPEATTQDQACARTGQVATAALATLRAGK